MKKVSIGFSKPKKGLKPRVISWLIRVFEGFTPYSHVFIRWENTWLDTDMIYEATGSGVSFTGRNLFEDYAHVVKEYELEISDYAYKELIKYCVDHSGYKYGYLQLFGILWVRLVKIVLNKDIRNPLGKSYYNQICSETVGYILRDIMDVEIDMDLQVASPKDIERILEGLGD